MTPSHHPLRFVIIGRTGCTWCTKVAELIRERGHSHTNLYYDPNMKAGSDIYKFLYESGLKTVPQVFLNGWLLGGYEEVKDYLDSVSPKLDNQLRNRNTRDTGTSHNPNDPDTYHFNF